MKIATKDINTFLQKPAGAVAVLFYGPDHGLIMQRGKALAQTLLGKGYDPFSLTEINEEKLKNDPPLLHDELSSMNLLAAGPRVVMLRDATDKSTIIIEDTFEEVKSGSSFLIVLSEDLGASSSLRKLFEAKKDFAAVPCYRDEGRSLEVIIAEKLRTNGIQTGSDVIHFIAAHEGNDRQVTLSEIDKIILYLGNEKRLTMETAAQLVGHNNYLSQDDLCMALADGNVERLQTCVARALSEGVFGVTMVRGAQRYFQRLLTLHLAMSQGDSLDGAVAKLRPPVFFKYAPPLKNHMRRWSAPDIQLALKQLLELERQLKSNSLPTPLLLSHSLTDISVLPNQKRAA